MEGRFGDRAEQRARAVTGVPEKRLTNSTVPRPKSGSCPRAACSLKPAAVALSCSPSMPRDTPSARSVGADVTRRGGSRRRAGCRPARTCDGAARPRRARRGGADRPGQAPWGRGRPSTSRCRTAARQVHDHGVGHGVLGTVAETAVGQPPTRHHRHARGRDPRPGGADGAASVMPSPRMLSGAMLRSRCRRGRAAPRPAPDSSRSCWWPTRPAPAARRAPSGPSARTPTIPVRRRPAAPSPGVDTPSRWPRPKRRGRGTPPPTRFPESADRRRPRRGGLVRLPPSLREHVGVRRTQAEVGTDPQAVPPGPRAAPSTGSPVR